MVEALSIRVKAQCIFLHLQCSFNPTSEIASKAVSGHGAHTFNPSCANGGKQNASHVINATVANNEFRKPIINGSNPRTCCECRVNACMYQTSYQLCIQMNANVQV
jgi:hypothetical protein